MVLLHPAIAAGATQPMVDSMVVQYEANGGRAFEQPLGVAVNVHDDEIVVANTGLGRVEFFGRDGRPHGYFVHRVADSAGVLRDGLPKHVAATADGRVLVSDSWAAYIDVCDFRGRSLQRLALCAPDDRIDTGNGPGPIAIAPDGRILVASRGKAGRVHVFSPEGTQLSSWGTAGSEPGQLASITAIGVAPNGEIVVTCASTTLAVQVFDASGRYLRGFGVHDLGAGNFSLPNALVITPDSRLWVCDGIRHQVQVFDMAGMLLGVVGGGGEGPGALLYPSALASDGQGFFALVETGGRRLRFWWIR
jgi:DNA-binding beta-propeller fold protein YncE